MNERKTFGTFGMYLSAGYAAFHLAFSETATSRIIQPDCPYKDPVMRDLWKKGWRDAEREFRRGVPFRSRGYVDNRVIRVKQAGKVFKPKFNQHVGRGNRKPESTVSVNKLENRFNNKFRTVV